MKLDPRVSAFLAGAGTVTALVLCVGLASAAMLAVNSTEEAHPVRLQGSWPTTIESITALAFAPPQYPADEPAANNEAEAQEMTVAKPTAEVGVPEPETTGSARSEDVRFAERAARRKKQARDRARQEPSVHEQYKYYYGGGRARESGDFIGYVYGRRR